MSRSTRQPYSPGSVPVDPRGIREFLQNELYQISLALRPSPSLLTLRESGDVPIGPTPVWTNPFIGDTPELVNPADGWDAATGAWTVGQGGLFQSNVSLSVAPFNAPGQREFYAGTRLLVNGAVFDERLHGASDWVPMNVDMSTQVLVVSGDVLTVEIALVHENQTGTVPASGKWYLRRAE